MEAGTTADITIGSISAGGDGVGSVGGRVVFVPASAPGDVLKIRVDSLRKDFARGSILEVIQASPSRASTAFCPLLEQCGGCNLGHLDYAAQVKAKTDIVASALQRLAKIELPETVVHTSSPTAYRNRAQFHHGPNGHPAYMRAASKDMLEPQACPVLVDALNGWLATERSGSSSGQGRPSGQRYVVFSPGAAVYVEGRDDEFSFDFYGKKFAMTPVRFFQSNLGLLPGLVDAVCAGMSGRRAADLYCGVGLFGSWLRDRFESLVCVEQDIDAVRFASRNVGKPASFAAQPMDDWIQGNQAKGGFDYIVVDPPRSGLSVRVRQWVRTARPAVLTYVSCDPVSLARDLADLAEAYTIERFDIFDFYPQTSHVECCVRLARSV